MLNGSFITSFKIVSHLFRPKLCLKQESFQPCTAVMLIKNNDPLKIEKWDFFSRFLFVQGKLANKWRISIKKTLSVSPQTLWLKIWKSLAIVKLFALAQVQKNLHYSKIGEIQLHIKKNSRKAWRWFVPKTVRGSGGGPREILQFLPSYMFGKVFPENWQFNHKLVPSLLLTYHTWKTVLTIQQNIKVRGIQKFKFSNSLVNWGKFESTV